MTMPAPTPREQAELLLYGVEHEDWMLPFAERPITELTRFRSAPWIFDVANVNPSWLPVLAVLLHSDAYIAGIYSVDYERRVILEASNINRYRGKPAAMDCFAIGANFEWDFKYLFEGVRVSGVDIFVTPSIGADQANPEWQAYVSRVANGILPLWVRVNQVFIAQRFRHTTRVAADYLALDWTPTAEGGLQTTFSLL